MHRVTTPCKSISWSDYHNVSLLCSIKKLKLNSLDLQSIIDIYHLVYNFRSAAFHWDSNMNWIFDMSCFCWYDTSKHSKTLHFLIQICPFWHFLGRFIWQHIAIRIAIWQWSIVLYRSMRLRENRRIHNDNDILQISSELALTAWAPVIWTED